MDPAYVSNLHSLLAQTVAPDTTVIKTATASLNQTYYKDPNCVPALFEILVTSSEKNIRQLACVELRKRVSQSDGKLWKNLSEDLRQAIKTRILQSILTEQASIVRHSTARVISAVADLELPQNAWPELLPFIQQATSSPTAQHREVGIFVLLSVLESVIEGLKQETANLLSMFAHLLQDKESAEVRITTVRALGELAQYIESDDKQDVRAFQGIVSPLLGVVGEACEANSEENARYGFDAIETLLILETPLLGKNVPELVQFCLQIGANKNTDDDIRIMALNALNWTIKYKKAKIQAQNLAKPILEVLLPIGAEADPVDNDEDSPSRLAFRAVDALATVLPPQQVFPPLHALVSGYMQSPDPGLRKAAMMAFGVTIEGCSEFIRPHMKTLWPLIDSGLTDAEPVVRKAACIAFACICEWLEDECAERHAILLPAIIHLTEDQETQQSACTALDAYLEVLETEIGQYLPMIMQQLGKLLASAPLNVKAVVTGAIGSAAHASKANFTPYFEESMIRLRPFLSYTNEGEEQDLRGISTDAIGTMAEAVGRDTFRPYVPELMKSAFGGITLGSARLKECSFLFFGVMAKVFEEEFAPYVEHVVPMLLESLNQAEGGGDDLFAEIAEKHPEAFSTGGLGTDKSDMTDEVVDVDPATAISVNSAIAIEKEIAAETMGTIFEATTTHFLPYLELCTLALINRLDHYYEGIRKSCINSLFTSIRTFYELSNPPLWEPGAEVTVPLDDKVQQLLNVAFNPIIDLWHSEDDKSVVSTLCQDFAETLSKVGPAMLTGHLEDICKNVEQILEGKSLCQQDPDAEEDDEVPEEQAEFDSVLISATSDLVASLATVLAQDFARLFGTFLPLISKYASKARSDTERGVAVGTLGEIVTGMKGGVTPFTEQVLQVTFTALSDKDAEVRSNAAFATGVLIENSDTDLSAHYLHILNALKPMFNVTDESDTSEMHGRDNAVGAVSRMISKNATTLPLEQVLPVLYGALPLKNDYLENTPLYRSIFQLFRANDALMMTYLDTLLPAFVAVLSPPDDQLTAEIKAELVQLVRHLNEIAPAKVNQYGLNKLNVAA